MKNILVVHTGKLGDLVCATPVFRALKEHYPRAKVVVAADASSGQVLAGNPHVAEYRDFRTMTAGKTRVEAFDAAVLLTPSAPALKMLVRARVSQIIAPAVVGGWSPYMSLRYRFWLLFAMRMPHRMGHYAPQEYLNMLKPLGVVSADTRKELFVSQEAQTSIDAMLAPHAGKKKVAIAPGAGNKIKEWPPERFNEVAQALAKQGAAIIVIGGPADARLAEIVKKELSKENVLDTTGKFSIEELKALVRRMDLFISVDTGPLYVAEAFDVPTVDIVGPMDEREQPPCGARHAVIVPKRTKPMLHIMNARAYDEHEARRQVEAVQAEAVLSAAKNLLSLP